MAENVLDQAAHFLAGVIAPLISQSEEELFPKVRGVLYLLVVVVALIAGYKLYRFFRPSGG